MKHLGFVSGVLLSCAISLQVHPAVQFDAQVLQKKVENRVRMWTSNAAKQARRNLKLYNLGTVSVLPDTDLASIKEKLQEAFMIDVLTQQGLFESSIKFDGFTVVVSYAMSTKKFKKNFKKPLTSLLKEVLVAASTQYLMHKLSNKIVRIHPRGSEKKRFKELWIKIEEVLA